MNISINVDLAIGVLAVLVGAELTRVGARMYARATRVDASVAKAVHRLILLQFDLLVVGLLAMLFVLRVHIGGPAEALVNRFGAGLLVLALAHAMTLVVLISRDLVRKHPPPASDDPTRPIVPPPPARDGARASARPRDGIPTVLMVLTGLSGIIDSASYLGLGRLFLAKMTGNVEVIGFTAAGVPGFFMRTAVIAVLAFLIGSVAAGRLSTWLRDRRQRWMVCALLVEAVLLLLALAGAWRSHGQSPPPDSSSGGHIWLIAMLALAMGFRNATARKLAVPDMTTTLITLTLADLAADSFLAGGQGTRVLRRIGVVVSMFTGATAGGYLFAHHGLIAPLTLAAVVATTLATGYPLFLLTRRAIQRVRPAAALIGRWLEQQHGQATQSIPTQPTRSTESAQSLDERIRRLEDAILRDQNRR
jgi:uncharacterized membrane protein YoaK (UPF0700 family)